MGASEAKFRAIVDARAKATKDFFFIQIGAHDGIMDDPIHEWIERFGWRGIFVEPQSAPFNRLKTGYIENGTSQRRTSPSPTRTALAKCIRSTTTP